MVDADRCLCGFKLTTDANKVMDEKCQTVCSGDKNQVCGGDDGALSLYKYPEIENLQKLAIAKTKGY